MFLKWKRARFFFSSENKSFLVEHKENSKSPLYLMSNRKFDAVNHLNGKYE